jgi:hypothetical protein
MEILVPRGGQVGERDEVGTELLRRGEFLLFTSNKGLILKQRAEKGRSASVLADPTAPDRSGLELVITYEID